MTGNEQQAMSTSAPVTISAVICSCDFGRRTCLQDAVASLQDQSLPAFEIIVVVDNNDRLLRWARDQFFGVHVVENTCSKGLSGARNTGAEIAGGAVVAYLDDDAAAPPNWVAVLADAYRDPDVMAAGGSAAPAWPDDKAPDWFPVEFNWIVGCTYRGMPTTRATIRNLFGCNMSFRQEVFAAIGGFHDAIGRLSDIPLRSCEETEFCIRLADHDPRWKILYLPDLPVRHVVAPRRCTFGYFVSRCYNEGLSKAVVTRLSSVDRSLADERGYAFRVLPRAVLEGVSDGFRGRLGGFSRAFAIVIGLGVTTAGYLWSLWCLRGHPDLKSGSGFEPIVPAGAGK